jgi:hypothetical protein
LDTRSESRIRARWKEKNPDPDIPYIPGHISENFFEDKEQYSERLRTDICFHHQVADPISIAFLALGYEIRISDQGSGMEKNPDPGYITPIIFPRAY